MKKLTIALAGNPNSGKTTLFNALTGSNQKVGNWSGVTVEKKTGQLSFENLEIDVVDLPGAYTLDDEQLDGLDERIAAEYITQMQDEIIVNVVDATNLERHLYLTSQLLEYGLPMVVVLTMMDRLPTGTIDIKQLEHLLGVPVFAVAAHKTQGLTPLFKALSKPLVAPKPAESVPYQPALYQEIKTLAKSYQVRTPSLTKSQAFILALKQRQQMTEEADILIADARYGFVRNICQKVGQKAKQQIDPVTQKLDKLLLNRFLGIPFFLLTMYSMFLFSINFGGVFQKCFDILSETIFVGGTEYLFNSLHLPGVLTAIFAYGLGKGLNTVITFIPVLASMFFFLAFLESSGYMARAAFVVDRLMRSIGLPGKAFVPLIVGFGCNVPAIMATRTLESEKDRILATLMSPFISCSARLAIFTVFVSTFFPSGGHNVIFALYLIGILVAVFTGYFLRNTLFGKELSPLLMELPSYHIPNLMALLRQTWLRLKHFLNRAGRVILPVCTLLGTLNALKLSQHGLVLGGNGDSLLMFIGQWLSPVFKPLGLESHNWPATVGLLMGTLAKEVVIATLNTLYLGMAGAQQVAAETYQFWGGVQEAFMTIPENFGKLGHAFLNPILASSPDQSLEPSALGALYQNFHSPVAAFSYLLFILLYVPCLSTMAAIKKELNSFWMYFSILWSTSIAYMTATIFYQLATIQLHYLSSTLYVLSSIIIFSMLKRIMQHYSPVLIRASHKG